MSNLIACSFFRTALDNVPTPWRGSKETLCQSFGRDRLPAARPEGSDTKKYLPAICGATFHQGTTRACGNVRSLQLVIFDFDNCQELPDPSGAKHPSGRPVMIKRPMFAPATMGPVCDELQRLQIAAYAWSTWSSTSEWPRFRLVLFLKVAVLPDTWPQLVEWVLDISGLNAWRECIDLPVTRDLARLHFLPALRPDGPPVDRREVAGELLVPPTAEELARIAPPRPELQPWQREVMERREQQGTSSRSGKASWAKRFMASDGTPLDLRTLDAVRVLEYLGCRIGPGRAWGAGVKHRTSCPWAAEHTHQLDDDCAVLFLEPGRWPVWHCSHSHHAHLGLVDLLEAAGVLRAA